MTTVIIDDESRIGRQLLNSIKLHPKVAHITDDIDATPLPYPEEELISLEDFKTHLENVADERFNLKLEL
jgi:hypothetical protein